MDINIVENFLDFYQSNFGKPIKFKGGFRILCPFHRDTEPSLVIYNDGGCYCFACRKLYRLNAVMHAYGYGGELNTNLEFDTLKQQDDDVTVIDTKWYPYSNGKKNYFRKRIDYEKNGKREKAFYFYEVAIENGKEEVRLIKGYVPLLLYHLLEIEQEEEVFYAEGEKCCDALWDLGIPATTLPIGASTKINGDILKALLPLKNKKVFILPDNDKTGKDYAKSIKKALKHIGALPEIIYLPDMGDKSDIFDYIELLKLEGKTNEEIKEELLNLTKENDGIPFNEITAKPTEWTIPDWVPRSRLTILAGREGVGKTRLSLVLACTKANGSPIFTANGFKEVNPGLVFYFAKEDELSSLAYWADTVGIKRNSNLRVFELEFFRDIVRAIKRNKPELVIIDPLNYFVKDENTLKDTKPILEPLVGIAKESGIAIVGTWHRNKSSTKDIGIAVSGHSRITAVAKRIIMLEEQENKVVAHFKKTQNTKPVAFTVNEAKFEWIKEAVADFGKYIPQGEKMAKLIKKELERASNKTLSFNDIVKLASPFGISKDYLLKIKNRYLPEVISEPVRKNGKFVGWFWRLPDGQSETVHLAKNIENTISLPEGQITKNIHDAELTGKKPLKINELEEQEKKDTQKIETVRLVESIDKSTFEPEGQSKSVRLVEMPKKNDNSLNNQDFFKLKIPVIPSEFLEKYKIDTPELYNDPEFREFAISHIINQSKQRRNNPNYLPTIVIDGVEYVDADELFRREGVGC